MSSIKSDVVTSSIYTFVPSSFCPSVRLLPIFSFLANEPLELKNHTNCMQPNLLDPPPIFTYTAIKLRNHTVLAILLYLPIS